MRRILSLTTVVAGFVAIAAGVLGVISNPVFAASPGQLAGGDNYVVKNVTKGGAYANSVNATCGDVVQFSMQLSNTQFGALNDVTLKATLPSGGGTSTATATTDLGGTSGTSDTASVTLGANQTISYKGGSTVLYDGSGNVIRTLDDGVTGGGVNIGTIDGSTTKFVNFKADVNCKPEVCPPGTTGTPPNCVPNKQPSVVCDALVAEYIGTTKVPAKIKFTAKATVKDGATISSYIFNFGDGEKADGANATVEHTYKKVGEYKATVQIKSNLGTTEISQNCAVTIKVTEDQPPVVVPPTTVTPGSPSILPSTGPEAALSGLFGTGALGYGVRQFIASRRRLGALLNL